MSKRGETRYSGKLVKVETFHALPAHGEQRDAQVKEDDLLSESWNMCYAVIPQAPSPFTDANDPKLRHLQIFIHSRIQMPRHSSVEHHSRRGSKSSHAHLIIVTGRVAGERVEPQVDGTDAITAPENVNVKVPIGRPMGHVLVEEGQHTGGLPVSHP